MSMVYLLCEGEWVLFLAFIGLSIGVLVMYPMVSMEGILIQIKGEGEEEPPSKTESRVKKKQKKKFGGEFFVFFVHQISFSSQIWA
jgi:hypothetical protein